MPEESKLAGEIAAQLASILDKHQDSAASNALITVQGDVGRLKEDVGSLKKRVYDDHDPVIIWARNFMDSYRRVVTAVVISGLITLAGFLVQVYYLLQAKK